MWPGHWPLREKDLTGWDLPVKVLHTIGELGVVSVSHAKVNKEGRVN